MAVERGARKEERRRHILHAVVRCNQGLQDIALALGKAKGGDKALKTLVKRQLRSLRRHRIGPFGRMDLAKVIDGKRQPPPRDAEPSAPCPNCPSSEIAMLTNSTNSTATAVSTFWLEIIATAGAVTSSVQILLMTRPMHGHRYAQRAYIETAANFAVKNTTKKPEPR